MKRVPFDVPELLGVFQTIAPSLVLFHERIAGFRPKDAEQAGFVHILEKRKKPLGRSLFTKLNSKSYAALWAQRHENFSKGFSTFHTPYKRFWGHNF